MTNIKRFHLPNGWEVLKMESIQTIRQNKIISNWKAQKSVFLANNTPIGKYVSIDLYSRKKVNLCYAKLSKPKVIYHIEYEKDGDNWLLEVPKIVYYSDLFSHLSDNSNQYKKRYLTESKLKNLFEFMAKYNIKTFSEDEIRNNIPNYLLNNTNVVKFNKQLYLLNTDFKAFIEDILINNCLLEE